LFTLKKISIVAILAIGINFGFPLSAQMYNFTNYTIEQGLPQSTVYDVFEDSRGYLWLGTEAGLAKFNGTSFTTFDRSKGLPGNNVRSICESKDGRVWAATDKGIGIFDGKDWMHITSNDGLKGSAIIKLSPDNTGRIWASTDDAGVNIISFQNDSLIIENISNKEGLSANFVFDILHDSSGKTWLALFGGINMISFENGKRIIHNLEDSVSIPSNLITSIDQDSEGNLWFGTYNAGAFELIRKNNTYSVISFNSFRGLNDLRIWDVYCDTDNQIWFGSNENGLFRWYNGKMQNISVKNGLPGSLILSIYRDSNRNLWLGSMNSGMSLFEGFHFVHYSLADGLPGEQVLAVKPDKDDNLWVGGRGRGMAKLKFEQDKLIPTYFNKSSGFQSKQVTSIVITKEGTIIAGSYGDGLAFLRNEEFAYLSSRDGLADNYINCVYQDKSGSIYVGTNLGFNEITPNKIFTINEDNGLINSEVQKIISDLNGDIWMGTMGGLVRFQKSSGIYRDFNEEEGLLDLRVHTLVVDKLNQLYIGTSNGIYKYDAVNDTITPFLPNALNAKTINSLLFYNDTLLIAGTTFGFNKIYFDKSLSKVERVQSYDKSNGFKYSETNLDAICRDSKNQLWFGTVNGLSLYRPGLEDSIIDTPNLHITDIRISSKNSDWNSDKTGTEKWFNIPSTLNLKYNQNQITIDYDGIYLKNPDKVRYRYQLLPNDSEWSPSTSIDSVTYARLNNGKYEFIVSSSADEIIWSEPVSFTFTITPPIWKTLWFYLLLAVIFAVMLYLYIKYREEKLVKEKEHLEKIVTERTATVVKQKEEILVQHKIVTEQKAEITSSITYARRIQQALLPGLDILAKNTSDNFVLFKPRDIVSGDFYWIDKNDNKLIITAADCTGHGVPGAFMSMLGISFMNKIIREQKIFKPEDVLGQMRSNIINSLHQGNYEGTTKDGMDMALCIIDLDTLVLNYSGAFNPVVIISENNCTELKANRMPVGLHLEMKEFTSMSIQLKKGDCIYLFTDGYQDQMGGIGCRKFMKKRLRELLIEIHNLPFSEQKRILEETLKKWMHNPDLPQVEVEQMDDITVLGFQI